MSELPAEAIRTASEVEQYLAALRKEPIKNHDEYVSAANLLKQVKAKFEEVEEKRLAITRPMDLSKQRIMDFFRQPVTALKEAEQAIKQSMLNWQQAVAKLAAEAQAKIDEAARLEAEKAKAKLEAEAVKLVQGGKIEEATQLVAQANDIEPEPVQLAVVQPKIADIRTFETWGYKIVDANLVPREYLCIDEKKLGAFARNTKGLVKVAGVRFTSKKGLAA